MASAQTKKKVVICGAGNAAHVFTTLAASNPNNEVHLISLYKTEAADFKSSLSETADKLITINNVKQSTQIKAAPVSITNNPVNFANADIVIVSLPAFAQNQYLNAIKENIKPQKNKQTLVALFPGLPGIECAWQSIFGSNNANFILLSYSTLPWAARIQKFGQSVEILGTKNRIEVCLKTPIKSDIDEKDNDEKGDDIIKINNKMYIDQISQIIGCPPQILDFGHIINMSLSTVVHPSIMYGKWNNYDGKPLTEIPLFYQGIDENTADLMSNLSNESLKIASCIEKETGLKLHKVHIYQWFKDTYGKDCGDASSLYSIIKSNPAYDGLKHAMNETVPNSGEYVPNFKYRYLAEDIPYGLVVLRGLSLVLSKENECKVPLMDKVIKWAQQVMEKEYLKYEDDGSIVAGKDIELSRAPQRYGIKSIKDLI